MARKLSAVPWVADLGADVESDSVDCIASKWMVPNTVPPLPRALPG